MLIIGCDFHSRFQQIAMVDTETGELIERRLEHGNGEAKKFYSELQKPVRVGMEATGYAQWFERMMAKLGHELWVGDAAEIRAAMVRKQKTDARDALHILDLLLANRFPRIWIPSPEERDLRQLLRHRHKLVCLRTSLKNQLQALAMGEGICRKKKLWATGTTRGEEANEIEIGNHCLAVTSCVSDCANTGPGEHSPKRHPARAAEKHGRSRGSHACREIQLQTHLRPDNIRPSRCPHDGNE